ncbi:MAG: hypothetical protein V1770_00950 [bacterium]
MNIRIYLQKSGITGFAIQPNIAETEIKEILEAMPESARVAFVDLAPTKNIAGLADLIKARGHEVVSFYDHHLDPNSQAEMGNVARLRQELDEAKIVTREEAPSCARLVTVGEWKSTVDTVFFHADFDGFISFMRGCGVDYPEIIDDADILDKAKKGKLSLVGRKFADADHELVPWFSTNPREHYRVKAEVYQKFADWLLSNNPLENLPLEFFNEIDKAAKEAQDLAIDLVKKRLRLLPGKVAFVDCLPEIREGKKIAFPTLKEEIRRKHGVRLVCTTGIGLTGDQIIIERPREWKVDLQRFLPKEIQKLFQVQIPLSEWEKFYEKWKEEYDKNPPH